MTRICNDCKHFEHACKNDYCDIDEETIRPEDAACAWFDPEEEPVQDRYYWLDKACDVIRNTKMDDDLRSHLINSIMRL